MFRQTLAMTAFQDLSRLKPDRVDGELQLVPDFLPRQPMGGSLTRRCPGFRVFLFINYVYRHCNVRRKYNQTHHASDLRQSRH